MKNFAMLVLLAIAGLSLTFAQPGQQVTILQPGPGLNDGTDNGSQSAGMDTYSYGNLPNDNYGTDSLLVGTPVSTCNDAETFLYVRFNLDSLPATNLTDSVYFGVTHYPHTTYCYSNCNANFYFYRVTQSWDETALNYSNAPTFDANEFFGPLNITFPNDFGNREYDITPMYIDWKNGTYPNYGLAIYSPTTGCNNAAVSFFIYSSDETVAAARPYLRVVYNTVGVEERSAATTRLNATVDGKTLFLESDGAGVTYELFGITGVKIACLNRANASKASMDVSGFSPGLYVIRARTDKSIATRKIYFTE